MKINKSILAAALGLSAVGLANAGTVYMTGSTACRGTVYSALIAPGVVFTAAPEYTAYDGGTTGNNAGNGANYMYFHGTAQNGGGDLVVSCHWSGSEAGILDVASNTVVTETFIDPAIVVPGGSDNGTNQPTTISAAVNLGMGDNNQAASRTKLPTISAKTQVAVVTFKWIRNNGVWTGSNVTSEQIRTALLGGAKRALFTGNAADVNDYVYVSGRDNLSGTRVNTFADSGFGIFTAPSQIMMDSAGNMLPLSYTTNVDLSITTNYAGDFGFTSGGTLSKTLNASTAAPAADLVAGNVNGYSVISYLSKGDADNAIGAGHNGAELTYNGVAFSPTNIIEGAYTFWGNEYIYKANNVANGTDAAKTYTALAAATGIPAYCDGVKAIKPSAMHAKRINATSDVTHN